MSDDRPNCHRCSRCDVNWPWVRSYAEHCPICLAETWPAREQSISVDAARELQKDIEEARARRLAFEDYYRTHATATCSCGAATLVITGEDLDGRYAICPVCDTPDPALTIDALGGWDDALLPED